MIKNIFFYISGLVMMSFGVGLVISASVGASPWDAVYVALSKMTDLTVGMWTILVQIVFIAVAAILVKKKVHYKSFITAFLGGVMLDFWLLFVLNQERIVMFPSWVKWMFFVIGIGVLSFGIAVYVVSGFPLTPEDEIMFAVHERFSCSLQISVLVIESTGLLLALCLDGPVGIGSFVSPVLLGICIQMSYKVMDKYTREVKVA